MFGAIDWKQRRTCWKQPINPLTRFVLPWDMMFLTVSAENSSRKSASLPLNTENIALIRTSELPLGDIGEVSCVFLAAALPGNLVCRISSREACSEGKKQPAAIGSKLRQAVFLCASGNQRLCPRLSINHEKVLRDWAAGDEFFPNLPISLSPKIAKGTMVLPVRSYLFRKVWMMVG